MTIDETVKLFAVVAALFPRDSAFAGADRLMAQSWNAMLTDIPYQVAEAAVQAQAAVSPFPPSISEIREKATRLAKPELARTADEAWSYAISAVRTYGHLRWDEAKKSMPGDVAEAVERFGFMDICMSENVDVVRGQFMRAWDNNSKRRAEQECLPPSVKAIAERMKLGLLPEGGR